MSQILYDPDSGAVHYDPSEQKVLLAQTSECPPACHPTHIVATVTPNGDVGVRGECQIAPPFRVTLSPTTVSVIDEDTSFAPPQLECCIDPLTNTSCFEVEDSINEDCCAAFGSSCAPIDSEFSLRWCPETGWQLIARIIIIEQDYCNWPPIASIGFWPSGNDPGVYDVDLSEGQTSVPLTMISDAWTVLTFDVEITLEWEGCEEMMPPP